MASSSIITKTPKGLAGNNPQTNLPPISIPDTPMEDADQAISTDSPEKVTVSPLDAEPPLPLPTNQLTASPDSYGSWESASSDALSIGSSDAVTIGSPGAVSFGSSITGGGKSLLSMHPGFFRRRPSGVSSPAESSGAPSRVSSPGGVFNFSPHMSTADLSELGTVDLLATPVSNKGAFTPLTTPPVITPLTTPGIPTPPVTILPAAPPPTLAYPVVAYHLPALDEPNNGIQQVTLQVTIAPKSWSISLSPPFPPSKQEHTVHNIPGGTLTVQPHPLCSCGHAHQEQKRHEAQLKENQKPRSRSGSATLDAPAAQDDNDKDWDPLWACTAACRIRRAGGKGYNPWRSRAPDGEIGVEYWVYVKPDSSEINNDEDNDVPLLSRRSWRTMDPRAAPPLWKRELLLVRIEDRLPVDVNPEDQPGRESGAEVRALERWLKNRCRIAGGEWGWADRFADKLSDKAEGKRKAL